MMTIKKSRQRLKKFKNRKIKKQYSSNHCQIGKKCYETPRYWKTLFNI